MQWENKVTFIEYLIPETQQKADPNELWTFGNAAQLLFTGIQTEWSKQVDPSIID